MRLGWSTAQLASHLGCEIQFVSKWEKQGKCPRNLYNSHLSSLLSAADQSAERLQLTPVADQEIEVTGVVQINFSKVA